MKNKKIAIIGILIALAMILSYIESLIPVFISVPGMKLGLTNLVVLIALYELNEKYAFFISMIRIVLVALTFGNMFSFIYSLAGGVLSLLVMLFLKRSNKFSMVGVSVAGGVAHNLGQILVAMFVLETNRLIYYFPVLCVSGIAAGIVVGFIGGETEKRIHRSQVELER